MNESGYPLVSIVVTSYNRAHWLKETIDSVLEQDYPNFELVISDNCSTDGTDELLQTYLKDNRVRYFKNATNIGMIENFYKVFLELAKGKYVTHVSSDDYLCNKHFISKGVEKFEKNSNIEVFSAVNVLLNDATGAKSYPESYKYYKNTYFKQGLVNGKDCFLGFSKMHAIGFGACMLRLKSFKKSITIDKEITSSADLQILLQLLLLGDAYFLDEECYVYRIHGNQASSRYLTSEAFIKNNRFVELPYQIAKEKKIFDEIVIERWRSLMLYPYIRYGHHQLLKTNKKEHALFYQYSKFEFPKMTRKILLEPKYVLKRIRYYFKKAT